MKKRSSRSRLTYGECLQVIANFGVHVAQSLVGGMITETNHPHGDLHHPLFNLYSEVKTSGLNGGPLIRQEQLERQLDAGEHHDLNYVMVLYQDRGVFRGARRSLPIRMGKDQRSLESFLARRTSEIFVVHLSVVEAMFREAEKGGKIKEHFFKTGGYRRFFRMSPAQLRSLVEDPGLFEKMNLDLSNYRVETSLEMAKFRNFKIPVKLSKIVFPYHLDDDSFDVAAIEASA